MKGRPITTGELERMLGKERRGPGSHSIEAEADGERKRKRPEFEAAGPYRPRMVDSGKSPPRYMVVGLRLGEAFNLYWTDPTSCVFDLWATRPSCAL